jgi:hypothetical protein
MGFNLNSYQPHLTKGLAVEGADEGGNQEAEGEEVYQCYYLDVADKDTLWTHKRVAPTKVRRKGLGLGNPNPNLKFIELNRVRIPCHACYWQRIIQLLLCVCVCWW